MCARYIISGNTLLDIKRKTRTREKGINWKRTGDVRPSQKSILMTGDRYDLAAREMIWGFPPAAGSGLMINARSETALQKPSFAQSVARRRCVVAAESFYEWDRAGNQFTFTVPDRPVLYMAGFYNLFGGEDRFILLTTAANESMEPVHDRMPLLLAEEDLEDWVFEDGATESFLAARPGPLRRVCEFEQLAFHFE